MVWYEEKMIVQQGMNKLLADLLTLLLYINRIRL